MAFWAWRDKSVGFAVQTDYETENITDAEFLTTVVPVEVAFPDHVREVEEFEASVTQVGAFEPPVPGSKHGGSFRLRMPVRGFKSGYNGASDSPGVDADIISSEILLWANALGSANGSVTTTANMNAGLHLEDADNYSNDSLVSAADAATLELGAGEGASWSPGNFVLVGTETTDTAPCAGFIKSISTDTLTLFENAQNQAAAADDVWPTVTAYQSGAEPKALSFRMYGDDTTFCLVYVGCVATSWTYSGAPGKTGFLEIEYSYTDRKWNTDDGGQQVADAFLRVPPALGGQNGYFTIDGDSADVADFEVSCEMTPAYIASHSGAQGVADVVITERKITATFAEAHASGAGEITSGEHVYENKLVNGTTMSLGLYVGHTPGKVFAMLLPAVHVMEQPQPELIDGLLYHRVTTRISAYTGAGGVPTQSESQNSNFRFGCA